MPVATATDQDVVGRRETLQVDGQVQGPPQRQLLRPPRGSSRRVCVVPRVECPRPGLYWFLPLAHALPTGSPGAQADLDIPQSLASDQLKVRPAAPPDDNAAGDFVVVGRQVE